MAGIPWVVDGMLRGLVPDAAPVEVGSQAWFAWLAGDEAASFSFRAPDVTFTARKEHRARRGAYWVAYRTAGRRQYKLYLGKAETLTPRRLTEAARTLAERAHPTPAAPRESAIPVLTTKLFAPRPPPGLVARPRLLTRLTARRRAADDRYQPVAARETQAQTASTVAARAARRNPKPHPDPLARRSPPWLLDSYHDERHRVGRQVLALTDGFNRLVLGRSKMQRKVQAQAIRLLLQLRPTREYLSGRLTGLGIAYPTPGRHRWIGRRAPDLACDGGRLYALLRDGRFLLVEATASPTPVDRWAHVRQARRAEAPARSLPKVMLVRLDGYIAWADNRARADEVTSALRRWCGTGTHRADLDPTNRP